MRLERIQKSTLRQRGYHRVLQNRPTSQVFFLGVPRRLLVRMGMDLRWTGRGQGRRGAIVVVREAGYMVLLNGLAVRQEYFWRGVVHLAGDLHQRLLSLLVGGNASLGWAVICEDRREIGLQSWD